MNTERVPISKIKPNPDNPRIIRDEKFLKLKKSIQDFPEMLELRPLVVDSDGVILGGNMRFRALQDLGMKEVTVVRADTLTPEQKREFIIKDNVGFGEWDYAALGKDWNLDELEEWGLGMPEQISPDEYGEDFSLKDGDKEPFQQMTFTLSDAQAIEIKNAIEDIKKTDEYKYMETFGNENTNGNALSLIIQQWAGQRK